MTTTIKMIAAVSQNRVIGKNNDIPWMGKYPADMKWFRKATANSEVIMGRKTFESMGSKRLPNRKNVIITSVENQYFDGIDRYGSLKEYVKRNKGIILTDCHIDTWLIGGAGIYKEGMNYADEIYLTEIPEIVEGSPEELVYFPEIDLNVWKSVKVEQPEGFVEAGLKLVKYIKEV